MSGVEMHLERARPAALLLQPGCSGQGGGNARDRGIPDRQPRRQAARLAGDHHRLGREARDSNRLDGDPSPTLCRGVGLAHARVNTTVRVTLNCCVPGEMGTLARAVPAVADVPKTSGGGVVASWILTTEPSVRPAALAYCLALVVASVIAAARAEASSALVLPMSNDTPSMRVASPPALAAALIAPPALASLCNR